VVGILTRALYRISIDSIFTKEFEMEIIFYAAITCAVLSAMLIAYRRHRGLADPVQQGQELTLAYSTKPVTPETRASKLPESNDKIVVTQQSNKEHMFECGHVGPKAFTINVYGLEGGEITAKEMCPECIMSVMRARWIRCALCGLPIMSGTGVAIYGSGEGIREDIATKTPSGDFMGCMRWDCCPSGGFYGGTWDGKQFQSAFDGRSAVQQAYKNPGKMIIVSDTGSPPGD